MSDAPERYQQLQLLGRGGMGTVHLAYDRVRRQAVALKHARIKRADDIIRFKREFRVVEQLVHPGLVRLYELGEDSQGLYFTMEVVEGIDLLSYCRGRGGIDGFDSTEPPASERTQPPMGQPAEDTLPEQHLPTLSLQRDAKNEQRVVVIPGQYNRRRLAHVLPQILETLSYLHGQGIVHRDLKPSNVMVRRDGAVKLLDFGLVAHLYGDRSMDRAEGMMGTVGYMPPEQINGEAPRPASDIYALGAMLYEIVAGRPLFSGPQIKVMWQHATDEPQALAEVTPHASDELSAMVMSMLAKAPEDRPGLETLAQSLLPSLGARDMVRVIPRPSVPELEGRGREQSQLKEALTPTRHGEFAVTLLCGPTGVGKTALAGWLARQAGRQGITVLRGRGRASERVAFNAVDGAVDGLALLLKKKRRRERSEDFKMLQEVAAGSFPVLTPERQHVQRPGTQAPRRMVFEALSSLLQQAAGWESGLLLIADDLQWADADSIALLGHLVESRPAGVSLLAILRDDVAGSTAESWLAGLKDVRRVEVRPLEDQALAAIIEQSARTAGVEPTREQVHAAVAGCGGRPMLAEVAGRALARWDQSRPDSGSSPPLISLIEHQPALPRQVVAALVGADRWTSVSELEQVTGQPPGDIEDTLSDLDHLGLVRRSGPSGPEGRADLYHDTVRVAALEVLTEQELVDLHRAFARHLEADPSAEPERLVRHLVGAGRLQDAARLALEVAARCEDHCAYGLAAEMYEVALASPTARREELFRARAEALEKGAEYRRAADCWAALAAESEGETALDAAVREAHALLAANDVSRGKKRLDEALTLGGDPPVARRGLSWICSALAFVTGPRAVRRRAAQPDEAVVRRAERDLRVGTMIGYFDGLVALKLLRRAYRTFDRAGALHRAAFCDFTFAYFVLYSSNKRGPLPLADRYLEAGIERHKLTAEDPTLVEIFPPFIEGLKALRAARLDEAEQAFATTCAAVERQGMYGTFEHLIVLVLLTEMGMWKQDIRAYARAIPTFRKAALDSRESALRFYADGHDVSLLLFSGKMEQARQQFEQLAARLPHDPPTRQAQFAKVVRWYLHVFDTDCHEARRGLEQALGRRTSIGPLRYMNASTTAGFAALAEANALRTGDPEASQRRVKYWARISDKAPPLSPGMAQRALAYAADASCRPQRALDLLSRAESEARLDRRPIDEAICRFQRGKRIGGSEGQSLMEKAREQITGRGASALLLEEDAGLR